MENVLIILIGNQLNAMLNVKILAIKKKQWQLIKIDLLSYCMCTECKKQHSLKVNG